MAGGLARTTAFWPVRPSAGAARISLEGRLQRFENGPANDRNRRISPVAAHSGDRLLSEPTAGTQPCRREPLFLPQSGLQWFPFKNWIRRIEAETPPPRQVRARAAFVR